MGFNRWVSDESDFLTEVEWNDDDTPKRVFIFTKDEHPRAREIYDILHAWPVTETAHFISKVELNGKVYAAECEALEAAEESFEGVRTSIRHQIASKEPFVGLAFLPEHSLVRFGVIYVPVWSDESRQACLSLEPAERAEYAVKISPAKPVIYARLWVDFIQAKREMTLSSQNLRQPQHQMEEPGSRKGE